MVAYGKVHGFQIRHHQNFAAAYTSHNKQLVFMSSDFALMILVRGEVDFLDIFPCYGNSLLTLSDQTYFSLFNITYKK
jgi:hypothetical protein